MSHLRPAAEDLLVFGLVPDLMPVVGPVPGRDGLWAAGVIPGTATCWA